MRTTFLRAAAVVSTIGILVGCAADDTGESTGSTESAATDTAQGSVRKPGAMRGVKIKHPGGDHSKEEGKSDDVRDTCLYMSGTKNGDYAGVVSALSANGVYDVFIKYPQPSQVPDKCDDARIQEEIAGLLGAMKKHNGKTAAPQMRAWVWERTWLYTDQDGVRDAARAKYVTHMAAVIERSKKADVDGVLEGVGTIETNLKSTEQVRELSVKLAKELNASTGNWLKSHTFLFPGAGMGSWFKGLNQQLPGFYEGMKKEVKYFSFIYKFMPSQDAAPKQVNQTLAPFYYGKDERWKTETNRSAAEQRPYIENTLGFADLRETIEWGKKQGYENLANVVFWGDSGDGLLQMKPGSRKLIHELLVEEMGERGQFFDFPLIGQSQEDDKTRSKFILLDTGSGGAKNAAAWTDWAQWREANASY